MVVTETVRDTVVSIAADSAMIRALLECDSLGQVRLRELLDYRAGRNIRPPTLSVRDNMLTATATVDSMAIYLTLRERNRESYTQDRRTETITVKVNELTRWQRVRLRIADLALVALACWLLLTLVKHFKR